MTGDEWMALGVQQGIVEEVDSSATFAEVYGKWFLVKYHSIKPQSLDRIEVTYNKYIKKSIINGMMIHQIDTPFVSGFINQLILVSGGVTRKEFNRIYQIVNNVLRYALAIGVIGARIINWDTVKQCLPEKWIGVCMVNGYVVPDRVVFQLELKLPDYLMYYDNSNSAVLLIANFYLGLRVGELASLKWSDIDLEKRVIYVRSHEVKYNSRGLDGSRSDVHEMCYGVQEGAKTENGVRYVPICDHAYDLLMMIKVRQESCRYYNGLLCYDGIEYVSYVRALSRTLKRMCQGIGVEPFSTHSIRKTFATHLHESGIPSRVIADLLGHSEISTTEQYYILGRADNSEEVRKTLNNIEWYK